MASVSRIKSMAGLPREIKFLSHGHERLSSESTQIKYANITSHHITTYNITYNPALQQVLFYSYKFYIHKNPQTVYAVWYSLHSHSLIARVVPHVGTLRCDSLFDISDHQLRVLHIDIHHISHIVYTYM